MSPDEPKLGLDALFVVVLGSLMATPNVIINRGRADDDVGSVLGFGRQNPQGAP